MAKVELDDTVQWDRQAVLQYLRSDNIDMAAEVAHIEGNASPEAKFIALKWLQHFGREESFGMSINNSLQVKEISMTEDPNIPEKVDCKVVLEIDVTQDMLNPLGSLHGGCSIFLLDVVTNMPTSALSWARGGSGGAGVSHAMNNVFHSPAPLGTKLRVICTSLSVNGQTNCARTEIWNKTNHRLVMSGMQTMITPKL